MSPNESTSDREIELTRVFDAPRELVWKAWTELEHQSRWWGPQGFTTTTQERDVRPGGVWRYVMHGPDGRDYPNKVIFLEVAPPERLSYKHGGEKDHEPVNFQVTLTFEKVGERQTRLTMISTFPSAKERDFVVSQYNAIEGGKQTLGRLAEHLQAMEKPASPVGEPFVMTRVFNVPLEQMWGAWTERDQLMKWFGPKSITIPHCTLDLKPGGIFHYCMRGPDGKDMWGKWTFREITKPNRLEFLVSFADKDGNTIGSPFHPHWPLEMHSVVTFYHHAGIGHGTVVRITWSAFNGTEEERNTFDTSHDSMREGWTGTLDKLAEQLTA